MSTADKPVVLFRDDLDTEGERAIAAQHLPVVSYRSEVPKYAVVIGRYSVLPFYEELDNELRLTRTARLINTPTEHRWIADALQWSGVGGVLDGLTPRSYSEWGRIPEGAYVVKGRTNSRKHQWNGRMFAPTRAAVADVCRRLWDDPMLSDQGLIVRPYVPLVQLGEGLNGLPITNEWRTFWLRTEAGAACLGFGFYWASHPELASAARWTTEAWAVAQEAAARVCEHATFFVLDLAETADGRWIVIEVNDGQMSGLSMVNAAAFYTRLRVVLEGPPR